MRCSGFLVGRTLASDWNWMAHGTNKWLKYACRIGIMRINTSDSHWINKKKIQPRLAQICSTEIIIQT